VLAGDFTPFPLITHLGERLYGCAVLFGLPYTIYKDRDSTREEVRHGHTLLVALGVGFCQGFLEQISIASFPLIMDEFEPLFKSMLQMLFSFSMMRIVIPITKKAYGADAQRSWAILVPIFMLAMEIGQVTLFLGSSIRDWQFWALTCLHEANSFLRNTGVYLSTYVAVRKAAGRSASDYELVNMEERRSLLAPSDVRSSCVCATKISDVSDEMCDDGRSHRISRGCSHRSLLCSSSQLSSFSLKPVKRRHISERLGSCLHIEVTKQPTTQLRCFCFYVDSALCSVGQRSPRARS
jgi:hypothetical protein